jgi:hypothetical protein
MSSGSSIFCLSREERKKILLKLMMRSTLAEKQGSSWTGVRYRIQRQLMSDLGRGQLTSTRRQSKEPRAALTQPAAPGHHRELLSAKPSSVLAIRATVVEGAFGSG